VLYTGIQYFTISKLQALYHTYLTHPTPENFAAYLNNFPSNTYSTCYSFMSAFFEHPHDLAYIDQSKTIIHQLYTCKADMPTVGASGSIFGIFMASAMLFPNAELLLFLLPFPIKMKYVLIIYSIYELSEAIRDSPADHIAHLVHLGGILTAYLFVKWLKMRHY
jgi:membrane associated rhomboid family serine protease